MEVLVTASTYEGSFYKDTFNGTLKIATSPEIYKQYTKVIYQMNSNYVNFGNAAEQLWNKASLKATVKDKKVKFKIFVLKVML